MKYLDDILKITFLAKVFIVCFYVWQEGEKVRYGAVKALLGF